MTQTEVLIIGASVAGLACAACLQKQGIPFTIIEKEATVAAPWRHHYDRLHLHTNKSLSHLPYFLFGQHIPRYPSRQQVVDYLEHYQKEFNIAPLFNTAALSVRANSNGWLTETNNGLFTSRYVIVATGAFSKPKVVNFSGADSFPGPLLHSFHYKTGKDFTGQKILVVGFGNSAAEIAMDLYEQGAFPSMAVRSAINVVPRDILGIPVLQLSLMLSWLPASVADKINAPLIRRLTGDITRLGLQQLPYGPLEQIQRDGNAPVLDIGTIKHIRKGNIKIYPGIDHISHNKVYFTDGNSGEFDAIIAAIGYQHDLSNFIKVDDARFADLRLPAARQEYFGKDGLYFCGFWIAPTGQIREIGRDAKRIAKSIAEKYKNARLTMNNTKPSSEKNELTVKVADQSEFDKIHQLNHEIFADEIPQHEKRTDGKLVDAFHEKNTYIVAMEANELVGMVCYNAVRPFSLDKKMANLDSYLPAHNKLVEIRLFAVKKNKRREGIALSMLKTLIPSLIAQGYDLGVISASLKELELYHNIGAVPFGELVGTKEVPWQPLFFHINNLKGAFKVG